MLYSNWGERLWIYQMPTRLIDEHGNPRCCVCKQYKHPELFGVDKNLTCGRQSRCRKCLATQAAQRKKRHPVIDGHRKCVKCEINKPIDKYIQHRTGPGDTCIECCRRSQMIERNGNLAKCKQCAEWKVITEFPREKGNKAGFIGTCKLCSQINEKEACGKSVKKFLRSKLHTATGNCRGKSKRRASFVNDVTLDELVEIYNMQSGICAITGVRMTTNTGSGLDMSNISIDRIDCSVGYTKDNVRLVCVVANYMRNALRDDELLWWARRTVANLSRRIKQVPKPQQSLLFS